MTIREEYTRKFARSHQLHQQAQAALPGGNASDANGWILSPITGIELHTDTPGKFAMRLAGDETTREDLP